MALEKYQYLNVPTAPTLDERGGIESFTDEFGKGIVRGFLNVGSGLVGTTEFLIPGKQESLLKAKKRIQEQATEFAPEIGNWEAWAGRVLGEALPYMGTAMVAGYAGAGIAGGVAGAGTAGLTGQAAALGAGVSAKATGVGLILGAASIGFAVEGQNAYDDAIKGGASENEANAERLIIGTINAAIEAAQITKLVKFHKTGKGTLKSFIRNVRNGAWDLVGGDAKKFTGDVLRHALEEGLEEAAQEGVSISIPGFLRNDIRRKPDGSLDWNYILNRTGEAFVGGAFAGGVLGAGGALIGASPEIGRPSDTEIDSAIKKIKEMPEAIIGKKGKRVKGQKYLPTKAEKKLWISMLEEQRRDFRYQDQVEPVKLEEVPDILMNHFVTNDGKIIWDETKLKERKTEEGVEVYDPKTGKTVTPEPRLSRLRNESEQDYVARVTPIIEEISHKQIKEIPALNREWDNQLIHSIREIDLTKREEHLEKIRTETGKRAGMMESVLMDEDFSVPEGATREEAARAKRRWIQSKFGLAKNQLKGQMGLMFDPLKFSDEQIAYYYQRLLTAPELRGFEKIQAEDGLNRLFGFVQDKKGHGFLPMPHQIKTFEKIWGPDIRKVLHKLRGDKNTLSKHIINTLNLPRALLASFDVSAGGRQGLLLLPIARKEWFNAVGRGYRAWLSPKYTKYIDLQIKTDPFYKKFRDSGGFLSAIGSLTHGEEVFISDFAHKIPGIRASERAYTTTLNSLRFYTFKKYAQQWTGTGKSKSEYKLLANFINHATGRGDIKGLEDYAPALNATFFAPRLFMGRIQSITDLFKTKGLSETRKIIAGDLVSFFAAGAGILGLLSLMKGVDVEKDPRSSDFGKIRFGNTRIDFWGGYSQIARLVGQIITAEAKGTDTKRIRKIDRSNIVKRFIQSKLSPAAGLTVDILSGETFLGKQLELDVETITEQTYQRFTPLFIQDVIDAAHYQGLTSAAIVAPLAIHGIGAMTYPQRPSSEAARVKDVEANKTFGVGWDDLGPVGQEYLIESKPEIGLLERQAKAERENFDMVARRLEEQRKVMNRILKKMPKNVKEEIKKLNLYVPGLSRYISNGWYLNDNKYFQYQKEINKNLSIYLTKLINLPAWNMIQPEMKASLMEEIINDIKKEVRDKMVQKITFEDIQRLK